MKTSEFIEGEVDRELDLSEAFEDQWSENLDDELIAMDRQTKRELDWQRWRDLCG
jgi:hypothetical protein